MRPALHTAENLRKGPETAGYPPLYEEKNPKRVCTRQPVDGGEPGDGVLESGTSTNQIVDLDGNKYQYHHHVPLVKPCWFIYLILTDRTIVEVIRTKTTRDRGILPIQFTVNTVLFLGYGKYLSHS